MRGLAAVLICSALHAAGPGAPVAGWTLDPRTATIRAIIGIPGALRLADPVALPFGVAAAEFAGDSAFAVTTDSPAHFAVISDLGSGTPRIADLGALAEGSRILAVSAKGAALVYSPAEQQLRFLVRGELSAPVSTAVLAAPIAAAAIEEDGRCAILGTSTLEMLCANGDVRRLLPDTSFAVAAIALEGRDLWFVDAAAKQVLRLSTYAHTESLPEPFASESDGLLRPFALALTPHGQVLVADAEAQAILLIDPSGGGVRTFLLDVTPSQLRPLSDTALFLVNDLSTLPFTLFMTEALRTYFVPAN